MTAPAPSARTTVRRLPARASYERARIDAILDEAVFCHVGFVAEGQPYVIPTIHARVGDRLYLHGSAASRMLGTLAEGVPVCVTATLLDGEEDLGWPCWAGVLPLGLVPLVPVPDARLVAGIAVPATVAHYRRVTRVASSDRASGSDGG